MNTQITISFIGLGLIGGSVAKSLKERNFSCYLNVYDTNAKTLSQAKKEGIADEIYFSLTPDFFQCDYLFLCTPVSVSLSILKEYHPLFMPGCVITDVGSVKGPIHKAIREYHLSSCFIGGHPMAGSERYGYPNSSSSLLENAYYILTPEEEVSKEKTEGLYKLIASTGALPFLLTVNHHDKVTAAISHLPHLIASSLVNLIKENDDENFTFKTLAAGGFKDITRIASSSPSLWQQICSENREEILIFLDKYIHHLEDLKVQLSSNEEDYLYNFFNSARRYRDSFLGTSSGPFVKQYVLTIDIPDRKGSLADVITLLSENDINIKNLGIIHNREDQEGALRMEFYDPGEYNTAARLLNEKEYSFHQQNR